MSGNLAIIGAPNKNAALIYKLVDGNWVEQPSLTASDAGSGDMFGGAVALSGTTAIVGAPYHSVGNNVWQGAAYVFQYASSSWHQVAELVASDGNQYDEFGSAVGISGLTAAVGASARKVGSVASQGTAYIFGATSSGWVQQAELVASDPVLHGQFGTSVAVEGETALIGSEQDAAYVFTQTGSTWIQTQELTVANGVLFGTAVALSGTSVLIGDQSADVNNLTAVGAAYVFTLGGGVWQEQTQLTPADGWAGEAFGREVALYGTTAVVGSMSDTSPTPSPVYLYGLSGQSWVQQAELEDPSNSNSTVFSRGLATSGQALLVAAYDEGTYAYSLTTGTGAPAGTSSQLNAGLGRGRGTAARHDPTCNSGSDPVNCASGDFWTAHVDVSIPGRGVGLDVSRTYNSLSAGAQGIFGYGWTTSYDMKLLKNSDGSVSINEADGSVVTAEPNGSGGFAPLSWTESVLTENADGSWAFMQFGTTTFDFSALGQLTKVIDRNGFVTTLSYNNNGQLISVSDPESRSIVFSYGANGLVSQVADPGGRLTGYGYDAAGDLTSVTDPMQRTTLYSYDASHRLLTLTSPTGGVTAVGYAGTGLVASETDPAGQETSFSYSGDNFSSAGGTTTITHADGDVTTEHYVSGELLSLTDGANTQQPSSWTFTYDPMTLGQTTSLDPDGNTTNSIYDSNGNLVERTDALSNTVQYEYNSLGEPLLALTATGVTTSYSYDAGGNPLSSIQSGAGGTPYEKTIYTYGDGYAGDITKVLDPSGRETDYGYDAQGDVTSLTTHPSASQTDTATYVYDVDGNAVCRASGNATASGVSCPPVGQPAVADTTTWVYDADNEVTSVIDPLGHTTSYLYDGDGNQTQANDPSGNVTRNTYDADNRKLSVTQGYGSLEAATTAYAYDLQPTSNPTVTDPCKSSVSVGGEAVAYCTGTTDALGNVTVTYFDAQGRQIEETQPTTGITTNSYDPAGNLLVQTTSGGTATYSYDADNRVAGITYSNPTSGFSASSNVSYGYDADGKRIQMTDGTRTTSYSFDSLDRLQSVTNGAGAVVTYGYDLDNEQTCLSYPLPGAATCQSASLPSGLGVVTRSYDGAGEVSSITDWQRNTTTYSYDNDGNASKTVLGNGVSSTSSFYNNDAVQSIADSAGNSPLASFSYLRNPDAQVTGESDTGVPAPQSQSYSYDQITRLASDSSGAYSYNRPNDPMALSNGSTLSPSTTTQELQSLASPITEVGNPVSTTGALGVTSATLPNGIVQYDQIILAVIEINTQSVNTPSGYTAVGTYGTGGTGAVQVQLFRRAASGGESSVALTYPTGTVQGPTVVLTAAFRGVDALQPLDGVSGGSSTSSSVSANSITTTLPNDQLVLFQGASETTDPSGFSPPAGMNEIAQGSQAPVAGGVASGILTSPGPSGAETSIWSGVDTTLAAAMVALRPSVTSYGYDGLGDRISSVTPGRPTLNYGYDQLGRLVSFGSSTSYAYNGDGLRMAKTTAAGNGAYTWDVSGSEPVILSDGSKNYVYGPDNLPLEQIQTPKISLVAVGSGAGSPAQSPVSASFSTPAQANDQIVVAVSEDTGETASISGYTSVGTWSGPEDRLQVFHKTASGGENSVAVSVSASTGDVHNVTVSGAVYRGVDPFTPIDTAAISAQAGTSGSSSVTVPGVTPSSPSEELVLFQGAATTSTAPGVEGAWSAPGMSEETDTADTVLTAASGIADLSLASNPSPLSQSTSVTTLATATTVNIVAALVALKPIEPYYYLHDQIGSTRLGTNQVGGAIATYTYSPYGVLLASTGSSSMPFGFAGSYTDPETGALYMTHRYYDPLTGQFLSVDPLVDVTGQPYAYASGDPVNETDPSGLCVQVLWVCIGGGQQTSSIGFRFDPGAAANTVVNLGRGASFGLSDRIANWISPGASCTVANNSLDELLGGAGTSLVGAEALSGLADGIGEIGSLGEEGAVGGGSPALDPVNQEMTVQDYASTFMKGSAARQIPGEFANMTVREALESGNTTVRKLLTSLRFQKG